MNPTLKNRQLNQFFNTGSVVTRRQSLELDSIPKILESKKACTG